MTVPRPWLRPGKVATIASAELPSPRLDRITPLGGAAGSSVEVEIVGADLEEADRLLFDHPGIKAEHVKDRKFTVSIAADVPSGTYDVHVVGKYGVSSPRLFAVSHDRVEVQEKEPNDDMATAHVPATWAIGPPPPARVPAPRGAATTSWPAPSTNTMRTCGLSESRSPCVTTRFAIFPVSMLPS